ncbi:hypothetical protein DV096_11085 [Bradymonadaceae bacterium TMQ3]|nr:hypothetical protein DV096_11085 [Bradymonadaceae bacterium TMQ3]TXC76016.1 hypothetical protein FRC91_10995 [Bradymonadales bacterium TMQ1]
MAQLSFCDSSSRSTSSRLIPCALTEVSVLSSSPPALSCATACEGVHAPIRRAAPSAPHPRIPARHIVRRTTINPGSLEKPNQQRALPQPPGVKIYSQESLSSRRPSCKRPRARARLPADPKAAAANMRSKVFMFKRTSQKMTRPLLAGLIAATTLATLAPQEARAAGFFLPTRGVASTGRAAASVAPHSADLDALWYNPAGITLLDDRALLLDLALIDTQVTFSRAPRQMPDGSTRTYEPVQNQAPPQAIPQILVGGPTGHPRLFWAAGAYTPYAPGNRYPVDGAQRYVLVDNTGSGLGYVHAAVGYKVNDSLSVGVGLQNFMGVFRVVSTGSGYAGMFGDPEDEDLDILAETTVSSFFAPTANLGATWKPHKSWTVGASLQLPARLRDGNATIDTRMPTHPAYDNATTTGNEASIEVPFPLHARLGIRHATARTNVELAVVYQRWSTLTEVEVSPNEVEIDGVPGVGAMPVAPFVLPQQFRDSISVHLGGEWLISDRLIARGGYAFERGAVPDATYSVFALDPDKHMLSLGAGYDLNARLRLDVSAAALIMPTRVITDSEVRQINPSDENDEITLVVGNGTYEHFGYIAGLSARYLF